MPEVFEINLLDAKGIDNAREVVLDSIRRGEIIVAAIEHAYVFACDAFDRDAVRRLHTLRADDYGIACQVMIGKIETLSGIAQNVTPDIKTLTENFWPGLLTLHLQPHQGLSWDLGDGGDLGEFAVRIPQRDFFRSVLEKSGPLAVSSAALAGRPPVVDIGFIAALDSEIGVYAEEGVLEPGPASTVVRQKIIGIDSGLELVREGAITLRELQEIMPTLSKEE
ncbi:MAG: Sua5/YciO/YrdC/YwlC family protein [Actinomycetes bacterium]